MHFEAHRGARRVCSAAFVGIAIWASRFQLRGARVPDGTVLITGATGFVGSHVIEAFTSRGHTVRAVVRPTSSTAQLETLGVQAVVAPLADSAELRAAVAGASVVVHLAALTRAPDAATFERVNGAGTGALVHAALAADPRPRRMVYLSSLAAVGPALEERPVGPADTPRPLTAYGRSKLSGEVECRAAAGLMEVAILRAPAVYGPRDRDLYHFFRLARRGLLPVPMGPERKLQMVHVADLAAAVVAAAVAERADGVYHIAEPRAYGWREMCGLVADAVGRRARFLPLPQSVVGAAGAASEMLSRLTGQPGIFDRDKAREMLAPAWLCETERARADLGFETRIALAEGFAGTARWYREQGML
jgi:dihydroflavonol-4-reductase